MVALSLVTVLAFPTNLSELDISPHCLLILEGLADNELIQLGGHSSWH